MTDANARTAANVILASAGIAAAYVILTRPPLRRLALRAAEIWLGASVPMFLLNQTRQAWAESGKHA
ncbi:MAG TPA: hypothetical protein VGP77_07500 [Vicinamibacterales bacterium]|jgi:hypothetical protein|nr:hypothetical protein [Vicinamibacterales bacterium]